MCRVLASDFADPLVSKWITGHKAQQLRNDARNGFGKFKNVIFKFEVSRLFPLQAASDPIGSYYSKKSHILMIRNVRDIDLGRYECKAENALGLSSDFITLMGNPLRPEFDNKSNIASSTSKTLSWITKSISPIIDYKFKFRKVPTGNENFRKTGLFMWNQLTIPADRTSAEFHTKSYKLEALAPSTVYEVMVQARNQYGQSDDSKILRFATPSEGKLKL